MTLSPQASTSFSSPEAPGLLRVLRLGEVCHRTGLSRSEIYRRIASGAFPAPIKLGERASAWPEHEVTAFLVARIAQRDAKAAA